MKKIVLFFVATLLCFSTGLGLTSCSAPPESANDSISIGIPASNLSEKEQAYYGTYIKDYVNLIKFSVCQYIQKNSSWFTWNTTVVIDRFYIYDFSQINPETLTEEEKYTFEQINNVIDNCQMIICCNGYWNFYSENTWIPSEGSARIPDMFISNNQFHQSRLLSLFASGAFNLPKETRILDFGNEYAFRYQPTYEEAVSFTPQYKTVTPVAAE